MYVLIHSFIHLGILKNIYAVCWQLNIYIFEEYEWSQNSTQKMKTFERFLPTPAVGSGINVNGDIFVTDTYSSFVLPP